MKPDRGLSRKRIQAIHERHFQRGIDAGIIRVQVEDEELDGPHVTIRGRRVVNFGTCSYLGLGMDERLVDAATNAIGRYGVTHSSSSVYTSLPLYGELEDGLGAMVNGHVLVAPTTTLGHLNALPVLVDDDALVLIDSQAHASLMLTTQVLSSNGAEIRFLPHNDMAAIGTHTTELIFLIHDQACRSPTNITYSNSRTVTVGAVGKCHNTSTCLLSAIPTKAWEPIHRPIL